MTKRRSPLEVLPRAIGKALANERYWFVIGGQAVRCIAPYRPSRDVDFGVLTARDSKQLIQQLRKAGTVMLIEQAVDTTHLSFEGIDVSVFVLPELAPYTSDNALTVTGLLATKVHAILDRGTRRDTVAMTQPTTHEALFIDELRGEARRYREFADQALAQVDDAGFFATLDAESNSLALIVKHVAGNLRSRWTDFFAADGEKPDRQREREFELEPGDTRAALMARWEAAWSCLLETLDRMTAEDLSRTVVIRAEPHTVTRAALRSLAHTAGHVGQIVLMRRALGIWPSA